MADSRRLSPPQGGSNKNFEVSIGSLDRPEYTVIAQYRPAELSVDQSIGWTTHATPAGAWLEFSKTVSRGASVELFLDATEGEARSVMPWIELLHRLANVRDPDSTLDEYARPHHCILVFGNVFVRRMSMPCVIESMNIKYTRFNPDGEPVRASVSLKLKEARWVREPEARTTRKSDEDSERTEAEHALLSSYTSHTQPRRWSEAPSAAPGPHSPPRRTEKP